MKVFQINICGNLSTGRIAAEICKTLSENSDESVLAYARNSADGNINSIKIGTELDVEIHALMARITDKTGFYSSRATEGLIKKIKEYKPDVIHLHNIHGYYLNVEILFDYLRSASIPVVWTLHDCWAYTGHCCYYSVANCSRWQTGCYHCPQKRAYPASLLMDNSKWNYQKKRALFNSVDMTLVPVSVWLANEVKKSFLSRHRIQVIYNGIDLNTFKPLPSDFRSRYHLENRKIILGVASAWNERKGLKDFMELSKLLNQDYQIVVVGLDGEALKSLPKNVIGIKKTNSVKELAEIYTAADIFFNASVEETFGMTTIEAMACGTPSIVYNATALPEIISKGSGFVVEPHDLKKVVELAETVNKQDMSAACIKNAQRFESRKKFFEYINLYKRLLEERNPGTLYQ